MNSPILHKIPEDVWRLIFLQLYEDSPKGGDGTKSSVSPREEGVIRICSVCRYWREIACTTSALWKQITFCGPAGFPPTKSVERFRVSFERSGAITVKVLISIGPYPGTHANLSRIVGVVMPYLPRVETFRIYADLAGMPKEDRTVFTTNPMHLLPQLPWAGLPLTQLRVLHLDNVIFTTLGHVQVLLMHCPKLEDVRFMCGPHEMEQTMLDFNTPVHLPSLQFAAFELLFLKALLSFGMRAPKLSELDLGNMETPYHSMPDFRFAASLESLSLSGFFLDVHVRNIIVHTPRLRYFKLERCEGGNDLVELLCEYREERGFVVPELERLTIINGVITDEGAVHLLDTRTAFMGREVKTLMLDIIECLETTEWLGEELTRRKRGTFKSWTTLPPM